nr:MAG TPA: hypothetical protein [Caudoviricetes sp.]
MYLLFGYKNNTYCKVLLCVVQYYLFRVILLAGRSLQRYTQPFGISVPGGFF